MAKSGQKTKAILVITGIALAGSIATLTVTGRLGWASAEVRRQLFPEQRPEPHVYESTAKGPVTLAGFVGELRVAWRGQSVAVVHGAAGDLAEGLLHHGDIEVGSLQGKIFVPWQETPWEAARKIRAELEAMNGFLEDEGRFVFRRK